MCIAGKPCHPSVCLTQQLNESEDVMRKLLVLSWVAALSTTLFAAPDGATLYSVKCAGCHGEGGAKTIAAMHVKPINGPEIKSMGVGVLTSVVSQGIGKMPAFAGKLTPEQIKAVCDHVLTLK
jgi:cytochrome c6